MGMKYIVARMLAAAAPLALFQAMPAYAQVATSAPALPGPVVAEIDRAAQEALANKDAAGFVIGVAEKGRIVFVKGYGYADLESRTPVSADSVFRIGSVTKQFTAVAVLLLAEQGKLSVDDTLAKYFPQFPRGDEVTIRQLLTHTSGIFNYTGLDSFALDARKDRTSEEMVSHIAGIEKLYDFDPGTGYSYSNSGYVLLGAIIEKASGQSYAAYLKANVLDPLGLRDTAVDDLAEIVPNRVNGYDKSKDSSLGFVNTGFMSMSEAAAAGAMRSTATDMLNWHQALLGGKLLKPASLAMMLAPGRLKDGRVSSFGRQRRGAAASAPAAAATPASTPAPAAASTSEYGFGINVGEQNGRRRISHGGSIYGFNSALETYTDEQISIVVLANTIGGTRVARAVAAAVVK